MYNKWLLHLNRSFVAFCISTNYFSPVKDRAALIAVVFPVSEGPKQTTIVQPAYNAMTPPAITSMSLVALLRSFLAAILYFRFVHSTQLFQLWQMTELQENMFINESWLIG